MRFLRILVLLGVVAGPASTESDDAFDPPTPEAIERAIGKGVAWLRKAQKADGSWGPCIATGIYGSNARSEQFCYPKGPTAFAIFTLASCGVKATDGTVQRGLKWLRPSHADKTRTSSYESSAIILMLTALYGGPPPEGLPPRTPNPRAKPSGSRFPQPDWMWMHDHVEKLLACRARSGGFGYWPDKDGYADASATQFAVLALRAASLAGYPVETARWDTWSGAAGYIRDLQDGEGGIPYRGDERWSNGMTAAGLATLVLCREQMDLLDHAVPPWLDAAVTKGLAHLGEHYDVAFNRTPEGRALYHYCHLYAVERYGQLSGRREIGGRDWYMRGAAYLLDEQGGSGGWDDTTCMRPTDVLGTCFALLFLKKATLPAVTVSR